MSAVDSARNLIRHYEAMEDLDMMANGKAGPARRAHDFIRVDLPVMIEIAEGRDPRKLEGITSRQEALLDLSPVDAEKKIKTDLSSAKLILGWTAPFAKGESKDFILGYESFTKQLTDKFIEYSGTEPTQKLEEKAYRNDKDNPLSPAQYENAMERERQVLEWPLPGDMVISRKSENQRDDNPFEGEQKRVEEIALYSLGGESSAVYYKKYRLEGESEYHQISELIDPKGPQHSYGVITESAGKYYFVPIEDMINGPIEPENMVAREIAGAEKEFIAYLDRGIGEEAEKHAPASERGLEWGLALNGDGHKKSHCGRDQLSKHRWSYRSGRPDHRRRK